MLNECRRIAHIEEVSLRVNLCIRQATEAACLHQDLTFIEVRLTIVNLCAVGKRPASIAKVGLFSLNNLSLLRKLRDERFVLNVVNVSRQFCTKCSFHCVGELRFSRHSDAGLIRTHSEHNEVAVSRSRIFFQDAIATLSKRTGLFQLLTNHLHKVVAIFDRHHRRAIEEVVYILLNEIRAALLIAIVVNALKLADHLIVSTIDFRCRQAKLACTLQLLKSYAEGFCVLTRLRHNDEREGFHRFTDEVIAVVDISTYEGAIRILRQLIEACVERACHDIRESFSNYVSGRIAIFFRHRFVFEHCLNNGLALLLVFVDNIDRLHRRRHRIVFILSLVLRVLDRAEDFFDLSYDLIRIDIAHNNYSLEIRAIPFVVVCAKRIRREVVDNAHQTDRHTACIATARIELL